MVAGLVTQWGQDAWLRLRRWLPGGACVILGHVWRGQFCARCGEFYP